MDLLRELRCDLSSVGGPPMRAETKPISDSLSKVQGLYQAADVADLILCIAEEHNIFMTNKRLQCLLVITDCLYTEEFGFFCFEDLIERSMKHTIRTSPYWISSVFENYSGCGTNSLYRISILNKREAADVDDLKQIFSTEALSFITSIVLEFGTLGKGVADLSLISSKLMEKRTKERIYNHGKR